MKMFYVNVYFVWTVNYANKFFIVGFGKTHVVTSCFFLSSICQRRK